ncbi:RICIN domain-containing protein [Hymenobacter lucidus]|uniref:RICIN domain-containing protein n=1 Tax=Hymenobacter lucidus TaxID=2880930 RepID=A0ABS8ATM7_9BACT|nr:RICIN domain-containing protein [Hymenobacter lucidus]MCB2408066.1 RICIN domain-containing protein [Hymenobacter lucidus]
MKQHNYLSSLLLAIAIWLLLPAVAQAQFRIQEGKVYKLTNRHSGMVLEIGGATGVPLTQGAYANQWPYIGTANQQWQFKYDGRYWQIINRGSGQALEIGGGYPQPSGAKANQWPYVSGARSEQWLFRSGSGVDNIYIFGTTASTDQVLEIGGTPAQKTAAGTYANQWTYIAGNYSQQWIVEEIPQIYDSTVFQLQNVASNKVLEIGNASTVAGKQAHQWTNVTPATSVGLAHQQWYLHYIDAGEYVMVNRYSGLALEVESYDNGARITQQPYTGYFDQRWELVPACVGPVACNTYYLKNILTQKVLEIGGGPSVYYNDGAVANQWDFAYTDNQKWTLIFDADARGTNGGHVLATGSKASKATQQALQLYPNPASSQLTLTVGGSHELVSVKITDVRGVLTTARYQGNGQVDVASLAPGLYFVTVFDGKQEYKQKFVKE